MFFSSGRLYLILIVGSVSLCGLQYYLSRKKIDGSSNVLDGIKRRRLSTMKWVKRSIGFIHIGKCGGTTAAKLIRKACYRHVDQQKCEHQDIEGETEISRQVDDYFHIRPVEVDKLKTFLVTARDPIDRVASWFVYQHPKNKIYQNEIEAEKLYLCYRNFDEFTRFGLESPEDMENMTSRDKQCMHFAMDIVEGKQLDYLFPHMTYNYKFYLNDLLQDEGKEIFVLRTEEFWDDWQAVNTLLGGGKVTVTEKFTHSKHLVYNNRVIQQKGLSNLCLLLCTEIQYYKSLLRRAVNLNDYQIRKSLARLHEKCPLEVDEPVCRESTRRKIAFVILGKSGGSSAAFLIKKGCFNSGCKSREIEQETEISRQTKQLFHLRRVEVEKFNSFIVTSRDPIERAVQVFLYQHPSNKKYTTHPDAMKLYDCYDNIDEVTSKGLDPNNTNEECMTFAMQTFAGKQPKYRFPHLSYNYQYYYKDLLSYSPDEKEIFMLRFESFWDDWRKINLMLGGGEVFKPWFFKIPNSEENTRQVKIATQTISEQGMRNLCRVLCDDIQVYKQLVQLSVNLEDEEKRVVFKDLFTKCPAETISKDCSQVIQ